MGADGFYHGIKQLYSDDIIILTTTIQEEATETVGIITTEEGGGGRDNRGGLGVCTLTMSTITFKSNCPIYEGFFF